MLVNCLLRFEVVTSRTFSTGEHPTDVRTLGVMRNKGTSLSATPVRYEREGKETSDNSVTKD